MCRTSPNDLLFALRGTEVTELDGGCRSCGRDQLESPGFFWGVAFVAADLDATVASLAPLPGVGRNRNGRRYTHTSTQTSQKTATAPFEKRLYI